MKFGAEEQVKTSNFQFSHVGLDKLGGDGYTIVDLNVDVSSSVSRDAPNLEKMIKTVVQTCRKSPRHNNLLIRVSHFADDIREYHGYTLLENIKDDDYDGSLRCGGMTALIDAIASETESGWQFGKILYDKDYDVNHIGFTLTDGGENASTLDYADLPPKIQALKNQEYLESSLNIVLHIGNPGGCIDKLKSLNCLDQFIDYSDLTPESLAKVANFVSESISSQSQHLGSGGPSQLLSF